MMRSCCPAWMIWVLLVIGVSPLASRAETIHAEAVHTETVRTETVRILAFGDSLTAGYGLARDESFPAVLQDRLSEMGFATTVINAGVSGDTTAAGLARLDWSLSEQPDIVIVALGSNDALRGIAPSTTAANLDAILSHIKESGARILLAGMLAPRNLDDSYTQDFDALFPALAKRHDVAFYPFFLEGVALNPTLNLSDGIHPNPQGVARMVEGIVPSLIPLLEHSVPDS